MISEKSSVGYRKMLKKYRFFGIEGTVLCLRGFNFAYKTHLSYNKTWSYGDLSASKLLIRQRLICQFLR
jgi:hypothetical protein